MPTYKWFKDGWLDLAHHNQYSILENGTLVISAVNKRHKGSFKCEAKNSYGQDQNTLMLNVLGNVFISYTYIIVMNKTRVIQCLVVCITNLMDLSYQLDRSLEFQS